jgi:hypothetical protein
LSEGGPDAIQNGLGDVIPIKFVSKLAIGFPQPYKVLGDAVSEISGQQQIWGYEQDPWEGTGLRSAGNR